MHTISNREMRNKSRFGNPLLIVVLFLHIGIILFLSSETDGHDGVDRFDRQSIRYKQTHTNAHTHTCTNAHANTNAHTETNKV